MDTRPSLRERKKDATRRAIEEAAWQLFKEKGYEATSVNDIAERAVVAQRTFFRYYPSKEAVLYPELDELVEGVRRAFAARPAGEPVVLSLLIAVEQLHDCVCPGATANAERIEIIKRAVPDGAGVYFRDCIIDTVRELVLSRVDGADDADMRADVAAAIVTLVLDTARDRWMRTAIDQSPTAVGRECFEMIAEMIGERARV